MTAQGCKILGIYDISTLSQHFKQFLIVRNKTFLKPLPKTHSNAVTRVEFIDSIGRPAFTVPLAASLSPKVMIN